MNEMENSIINTKNTKTSKKKKEDTLTKPKEKKVKVKHGQDNSDDEILEDNISKIQAKDLSKQFEVEENDNSSKYKQFYQEEFEEGQEELVEINFEPLGTYMYDGAMKRIEFILKVLANFASHNVYNKSRQDYIEVLKYEFMNLYDYNEDIIEILFGMLSPADVLAFIKACETNFPTVVRVNLLKTKRKELARTLIARGVNLDPVDTWDSVGLKIIKSNVPIGATPEYLAGHYIIQAPSSFLPVYAMDCRPGERILDLCAAPGGKSSHIAMMMKNAGELWINDPDPERCKAIKFNLNRLGVSNHIIVSMDGRVLPRYVDKFDRVLVDAPCSGLGVISKDKAIKLKRTAKDVERIVKTQKQLLLAAIDMTDASSPTGGIIVYSTCSITLEENERVVQYALEKRDVKLVNIKLDIGAKGYKRCGGMLFDDSMEKTKRIWPHQHEMDGFFVAKFKKVSNFIDKELSNTSMLHDTKKKYREDIPKKDKNALKRKKNGKTEGESVQLPQLRKSKLRKITELANHYKKKYIEQAMLNILKKESENNKAKLQLEGQ